MSGKRGAREGSVYRRPDGLWVAAVSIGAGKRKVLYGKTRAAVAVKSSVAVHEP